MTATPTHPQTRLRFGDPWNGQGVIAETAPSPILATELGVLFDGDCLHVLPHVRDESIDTVFADPPSTSVSRTGRSSTTGSPTPTTSFGASGGWMSASGW